MASILLVEDNSDLAKLVKCLLERRGHRVQIATSGKEALNLLERVKPDLILLDVIMPGMSGEDVLREIRKSEALKDIPVYIFSVLVDRDAVHKWLSLGATGFISKPFDIVEIEKVISGGRNPLPNGKR